LFDEFLLHYIDFGFQETNNASRRALGGRINRGDHVYVTSAQHRLTSFKLGSEKTYGVGRCAIGGYCARHLSAAGLAMRSEVEKTTK